MNSSMQEGAIHSNKFYIYKQTMYGCSPHVRYSYITMVCYCYARWLAIYVAVANSALLNCI